MTTLRTILQTLSDRPVGPGEAEERLNREVIPIVRTLRAMISGLEIASAFRLNTRTVTEAYTAQPWDDVVADPTGGSFVVSLPSPTDASVLGSLIVIRTNSERLIRQRVSVTPVSGLIENQASFTLGGEVDSIIVTTNGLEWRVAAQYKPRRWVGAYSVDFSELPDQTIVNGNQAIDGVTWTGFNVGNSSSFAIVNGTGLCIVANTTSTNYDGLTRTTPMIAAQMHFNSGAQNFGFDYGTGDMVLRIQARAILENCDADFEGASVGVEYTTTPTSQNWRCVKAHNAFFGGQSFLGGSTVAGVTTYGGGSPLRPTHDVLQVLFEAPERCAAASSVYDGSGYLNAEFPVGTNVQGIATPLMRSSPDVSVFLNLQTVNANGTAAVTFTRFQLDYAQRWPSINR